MHIANAPVSWGIYEFKDIEPKYPYSRVLDEIVETGYTGLELGPWGYLPTDPALLRPELASRKLQLLSSYVPVKLVDPNAHAEGEAQALRVGRLLADCGAQVIVLADDNGTLPDLIARSGHRTGSILSADEWDVFAQGVNRIARRVHDELGLKIVFHHHCAGYVETPEETRNLMGRVDADLVGLCLDTGHWHYGGGDAVQCLDEYGERVRYLHLKDCSPDIRELSRRENLNYREATQAGLYCELGDGMVDFPTILSRMQSLGYDGWAIVEQDVLVDDLDAPRLSARRNREYLRKLGF
ncbi:MAG: TIM barrel protein [Anaerolineae bacterium]|nr:TIM barrel protein [Anaerolineae bacterium]